MNIDKFGHHVHKRLRVHEPIDILNKALLKTETGEFNLHSVRLNGIKLPISADDAVNKEYVDNVCNNYYSKRDVQSELKKLRTEVLLTVKSYMEKYYTIPEIEQLLINKSSKPILK